jgi:hypothetical protein
MFTSSLIILTDSDIIENSFETQFKKNQIIYSQAPHISQSGLSRRHTGASSAAALALDLGVFFGFAALADTPYLMASTAAWERK